MELENDWLKMMLGLCYLHIWPNSQYQKAAKDEE
jgi:hypothetical protein